jgi:hypothetical protein
MRGDDDVLRKGWFWDAIAGIMVAAGFACVFASTRVELPGCREPGRTQAEDHATSLIGGAMVAAALAVVVLLVGRSRARPSRWHLVTALLLPIALFVTAFGYWLVIDFPCAGD